MGEIKNDHDKHIASRLYKHLSSPTAIHIPVQ